MVVGAVDQHAANAHVAHLAEGDLWWGGSCRSAKLANQTDQPDSDGNDADSDTKLGCGSDPDRASNDYSERNEIGEQCVAHGPTP